jgi:hypothetical protein
VKITDDGHTHVSKESTDSNVTPFKLQYCGMFLRNLNVNVFEGSLREAEYQYLSFIPHPCVSVCKYPEVK